MLYTTDHKVYAKTAFKKGALKLFPAGAVQKVKEASAGSQDKKQKKDNVVKVVGSASTYTVQQPKYDLQKGEGCLVPFFWVTQTQEEGQAVLTLQEQKFDWLVSLLKDDGHGRKFVRLRASHPPCSVTADTVTRLPSELAYKSAEAIEANEQNK